MITSAPSDLLMPPKNKRASSIVIRPAQAEDSQVVLDLIVALAEYEQLDPPDDAARARLLNDAFGANPRFHVLLAELPAGSPAVLSASDDTAGGAAPMKGSPSVSPASPAMASRGAAATAEATAYLQEPKVVGYAFMMETYSTFLALPTLYLEDLFVLPEYRNRGAGSALFRAVVAEAALRGCGRVEWVVLDWNMLARNFYHKAQARHMDDWCYYRLSRDSFGGVLAED